jgi:signal peptidase
MQFINTILASLALLVSFVPKVFIVESGSMEPHIKTGSLVFSVKSDFYNRNDVITFKNANGVVVTHRVIYKYIKEKEYVTAGDANKTIDNGSTQQSQIIGKVVFTLPYAGYVANFAKTPKGFILFVIIPATIIIYEEFKFLKSEFAKLLAKLRAKKKELLPHKSLPKISILVPILACLAVLASVTTAFFSDSEKSSANILGAAGSYGEKTANLFDSNEFTCTDGATNFSKPQAKVVVLKKVGGNINATVQLIGATPNSSYDIWLNQDPGGCPLGAPTAPAAITTDGSGNGTGSASAVVVSGATKFWISAVGGGQVLRSVSVSL